MTELRRPGTVFSPAAEQRRIPSTAQRKPAASLQASTWLLALPTAATALLFVLYWVPELGDGKWLPIGSQLAPLVSRRIASDGQTVFLGHTALTSALALALLAGAVVAFVAVRSRSPLARMAILPATGLTLLTSLGLLLAFLAHGSAVATGLVLLVVTAVLSVQVARTTSGVALSSLPTRSGRTWQPVAVFGATVLLPLALGRALFGQPLRDAAESLRGGPLATTALTDGATFHLWLAGVLVAAVAVGAWHLLPPWGGRPLVAAVAAVVLGLGPGIAYVFPQADHQAQALATRITTENPVEELGTGCPAWWRESVPQHTLTLSGTMCETVQIYRAHSLLSSRTTPLRMGRLDVQMPDGTSVDWSRADALYGSVFVTAASSSGERTPNLLVGLDFATGKELWRHSCGEQPLRVRFAGTGHDSAGSARVTRTGETARILVSCGEGKAAWLSPATGGRA